MLYNKNNLIIHQITSKDENRPELSSVLFKKDRSVATDSFKLIEVKNIGDEWQNLVNDYPILPDKSKPLVNFPKKGIMVDGGSVKKALKNLNEVKSELSILKNACIVNANNPDNVKIVSTDLNRVDAVITKKVEGNYPNYEQVVPQNLKNYRKVLVDIKQLKQLVDTLSQMELNSMPIIELYVADDENKPLVIKTKNDDLKQEITGLLMPVRQ